MTTHSTHGKGSRRLSPSLSDFEIVLPATSANLGPAFDAAALALQLFLKVRARVAGSFSIRASGRDREICGDLENHLILTTYREVLQAESKPVQPLFLRINNEIPIGKGCGSSAAARLAGIALAVHFGKLRWSESRILGEASRREQHADNAAACWLGGLAIARMNGDIEARAIRIIPSRKWRLLLAMPKESLATEEARRALPAHYSREDAVANIQNSMMLQAALRQGRADLLASVLEDRLHQPYRAQLCPLLPVLQDLGSTDGMVGAVLSGAGPSVLIFADPKRPFSKVKSRVRAHLRNSGLSPELIATKISIHGANRFLRARKASRK